MVLRIIEIILIIRRKRLILLFSYEILQFKNMIVHFEDNTIKMKQNQKYEYCIFQHQ